jgi:hypothetical protein
LPANGRRLRQILQVSKILQPTRGARVHLEITQRDDIDGNLVDLGNDASRVAGREFYAVDVVGDRSALAGRPYG